MTPEQQAVYTRIVNELVRYGWNVHTMPIGSGMNVPYHVMMTHGALQLDRLILSDGTLI